jgi:hypothetical protein
MSESSWSDGVTHYTTDSSTATHIAGRVSYITIGAWTEAVAGMRNKVTFGFRIGIKIGATTNLTLGDNLINHPRLGKYVRFLDDQFHGVTGWVSQKAEEFYNGVIDRAESQLTQCTWRTVAEFNARISYGSQSEDCESLYRITSPYIIMEAKQFNIDTKKFTTNGKVNYL